MSTTETKDSPALKCCGLLVTISFLGIVGAVWIMFRESVSLVHKENYENGIAWKAAAAGGWYPSWFPVAATDIRHTHDLDSNLSQTRFILSDKDFEVLNDVCVRGNLLSGVEGSYLEKDVWNRKLISEDIESGKAKVYVCDDRNTTPVRRWQLVREGNTCYLWNLDK